MFPSVKGAIRLPGKTKEHKQFAARLAAAMERKGWKGRGRATRLAEALRASGLKDASSQLVAGWLRGVKMPRSPYADRLPAILDVPAGFLSGASGTEMGLVVSEEVVGYGGATGEPGRLAASSGQDQLNELLGRPFDFARRMVEERQRLGAEPVLAILDDYEEDLKRRGIRRARFFAWLRRCVREGRVPSSDEAPAGD